MIYWLMQIACNVEFVAYDVFDDIAGLVRPCTVCAASTAG